MEPLTALGLVCNVLQLVDQAIKCGKIVHKLHKDGFTDDQTDLEAVADTMEEVVTGLQKAPNNANVRKSALNPEIAKLLTKSVRRWGTPARSSPLKSIPSKRIGPTVVPSQRYPSLV